MSCEPDVTERPRKDVDFVLLACDGVWEWEENEEPTLDKSTKGAVADIHSRVYDKKWSDKTYRQKNVD